MSLFAEGRDELGSRFLGSEVELYLLMTFGCCSHHNHKRKVGIAESAAFVRWILAWQPGQSESIRLMTDSAAMNEDCWHCSVLSHTLLTARPAETASDDKVTCNIELSSSLARNDRLRGTELDELNRKWLRKELPAT